MTHLQKVKSQKLLLVLSVASVLNACSGDSNSVSELVSMEEGGSEFSASALTMSGTIIVEQKGGETVVDGVFAQSNSYEHSSNNVDNTIHSDSCQVSSVKSNPKEKTTLPVGAQTIAEQDLPLQPDAIIESRVQGFDALVKQELGDPAVYASTSPTLSAALPEDTGITFGAGSAFGDSSSSEPDRLTIKPLMPLVWLAPETGVMSSAASSLRWEASFNHDVKIKLRLTAIDFSDSENPLVVTVACDLVDDGLHTLSAEFQQQLPNDGMGIVVYAVRERVQTIGPVMSGLKVVQLSYPKPLAP